MFHSMAWAVAPPPPPDGPPAPVLSSISISGPVSVDEQSTAQYVCMATYSDGSSAAVSASWSDDSVSTTISSSGVLTSGNVTADENVVITAVYNGVSASYNITVNYVAPKLDSITISGATSVNEQTTSQYFCTANWSDGTSTTVSPSWSENSAYASISSSGLLSAGNVASDQNATITASYGGKVDTHAVTIKYVAPALSSITISGPSNVNEETTAQYVCTANWSDGTTTTVSPTWSENSGYASISSSGLLSAGNVTSDKSMTVSASYNGKSDTHAVTIKYVAPTLSSIVISGPASMDEETSAQLVCTANWSDGTTTTVTPSWSDNSGYVSVNSSGTITAGNVASDQIVTITATYSGKSDTHVVRVLYVAPPVVVTSISISGPTGLVENASASFSCMAHYSDGTSEEVSPSWSENAAFATINDSGALTVGNIEVDSSVTVTASFQGYTDSQTLSVRMVGTCIVYPLSGFEGTLVRARLWDDVAKEFTILGEMVNPDELVIESLNANQWYWIVFEEYDELNGEWVRVQANWINM